MFEFLRKKISDFTEKLKGTAQKKEAEDVSRRLDSTMHYINGVISRAAEQGKNSVNIPVNDDSEYYIPSGDTGKLCLMLEEGGYDTKSDLHFLEISW